MRRKFFYTIPLLLQVDKKNILDAYDLCYPVANAKLGLQINNDLANRDIFLNAFSCEEDVSVYV